MYHHSTVNVPLTDFVATTFLLPLRSRVSLHGRIEGHLDQTRLRQPTESARAAHGGYSQSDIINSLECVEIVKIVEFFNASIPFPTPKLPFSEHYGNSFHCTIFAYR